MSARSRGPVLALLLVMVTASLVLTPADVRAEDALVLRVGGQDQMKTRNPLAAIANDIWTEDVLQRVYGTPMLPDRTFALTSAYIAKGVDADEDGMFEPSSEYNVWGERANASTPLQVVAYYDFNGVRWHDGTQMTVWDLLFSYHLNAMNPRFASDVRVLLPAGTYEGGERQLNISLDARNWEGEGAMPGNPALRVAVRFRLSEPYARFTERTLAPLLLPMHVWSRTGGGRHPDFGCAVWIPPAEAAARGVPECGTPTGALWGLGIRPTEPVPGSSPYDFPLAETWKPSDADVVGSGPFRFVRWTYAVEARLARNDDYYVGGVHDPTLAKRLPLPRITGIVFLVYRTTQLGVYALQSGEIDFYHWNLPGESVPDLLKIPDIQVEANAEPGFMYLGYNLRVAPWGYEGGDPTRDVGLVLRRALAQAIDKESIVMNRLLNFGIVGDGWVSPANTFWYNANVPKLWFNLAAAAAILDSPEARAVGIGPDPPGFCDRNNPGGCRTLPGIGNGSFEILNPVPDYDPIIASAAASFADNWRQIGLNAVSRPTAFGEVVNRVTNRTFELFVLGWRLGWDPDYLFDLFHSSNAAGLNHAGVADPTLDACLASSRREMNRDARRDIIFQCQQILGTIRPTEPLYYRTNIEAYRGDRFVNWTVHSGTIWNFWSLQGIRPLSLRSLRVAIGGEIVVPAGSAERLTFSVRDDLGASVAGASLTASVSAAPGWSPGNLSAPGQRGPFVNLTADAGGRATVSYEAPVLYATTLPVIVRVTASHLEYTDSAVRETVLVVVGPDLSFLRLEIQLPIGDLTYPAAPLPAQLVVRDAWGLVGDPQVGIEVYPAATPSPRNGSARDVGMFNVTFPAAGVYTISVNATKPGHRTAWGFATVWVVERPMPRPPPGVTNPPIDPGPVAAVVLGGAAAVAALLVVLRIRARRGRA